MTYRNNFDHLGNPVREDRPPWRISDLIICTFCLAAIVALASGGLA